MAWPGEQQDHRKVVTAPSTTWDLLRAPGGSSANFFFFQVLILGAAAV